MPKLQSDLMQIHRKILEDGEKTRLADVTDSFIEFSNGSHVLLEPVNTTERLSTYWTEWALSDR